jgi:hypothetical protein
MIGLSFPTLEELPYVLIIPENRIISLPTGHHSPSMKKGIAKPECADEDGQVD